MMPSESGAATSADDVVREQKQDRPIVQQDVPAETTDTTESSKEPEEESEERPKRRKGL